MWGLADEYRALKHSVSKEANFDSIFVDTAAPGGQLIHNFVSDVPLRKENEEKGEETRKETRKIGADDNV